MKSPVSTRSWLAVLKTAAHLKAAPVALRAAIPPPTSRSPVQTPSFFCLEGFQHSEVHQKPLDSQAWQLLFHISPLEKLLSCVQLEVDRWPVWFLQQQQQRYKNYR